MLRVRTGESRRRALFKSLVALEARAQREEAWPRRASAPREVLPAGEVLRRLSPPPVRERQRRLREPDGGEEQEDSRGGGGGPTRRARRVAEAVRGVLSYAVLAQKVPQLLRRQDGVGVQVVDVRMAADLKRATVYFLPPEVERRAPGSPEGERVNKIWLGKMLAAKPALRKVVGDSIKLRYVPDLDFKLDDVSARVDAVNSALSEDRGTEE